MTVNINDREIPFPSTLHDITLGQRIEYDEMYGRDLREWSDRILKSAADEDRDIEISAYQVEKMFAVFAYFSGYEVEVLRQSGFVEQIAQIYYQILAPLFEDVNKAIELQNVFEWNDQKWFLPSTELKNGSPMTFGEFIDAKQVVKQMAAAGCMKHEYLLFLCVIYLRRDGEKYEEAFLYDDSEKLALMKTLPLDIAEHVAFFLTSCVSTASSTLGFFKKAA